MHEIILCKSIDFLFLKFALAKHKVMVYIVSTETVLLENQFASRKDGGMFYFDVITSFPAVEVKFLCSFMYVRCP